MPTRRRLLGLGAAGAGALAGCAVPFGRETDHRVRLEEVAAVPPDAGVDIGVEQRGELVTDARTVGFAVTTTNRGRPKRLSVAPGHRCCLFDRRDGASRPGGLWLHHVDDQPERKPGEWTADRDRGEPRRFPDYGCQERRYGPGESVTNEYRLWSDYRYAGYMPAGSYRFEADLAVGTVDGEAAASFRWGFRVSVEPVPA